MQLSGKITHSVVTFLEQQGEDITSLQECTDVSMSFFCDPSSWLEADKMEDFLHQVNQLHQGKYPSLMKSAGHKAAQLKAWGVLDNVLNMMSGPDKIFHKPQKFLTYFVNVQESQAQEQPATTPVSVSASASAAPVPAQSSAFQIPNDLLQRPLALEYLIAAFEALPTFMQQPAYRIQQKGAQLILMQASEPLEVEPRTDAAAEPVKKPLAGAPVRGRALKEAGSTDVASKEVSVEVQGSASSPVSQPVLDMVEKTQATLEQQQHLMLSKGDEMNKLLLATAADFLTLSEHFTKARQLIWHLSQSSKSGDKASESNWLQQLDWSAADEGFNRVLFHGVEQLEKAQRLLRPLQYKSKAEREEVCRQFDLFDLEK